MPPENISPEQKVKFMTSDQISRISDESGKSKKSYGPVILGLFVAAILIFLGTKFFIKHGNLNILSPLASGDNNSTPTFTNPLNGEIVNEADATLWKDERPIGVMINNHLAARPQSGLINADFVYEIVAEGGITRHLAFFLSNLPTKIGPVRSTREYFLVLTREMGDAMLMHIGYSPQALLAIETWPVRSLERGGATFWRDQARIDRGIPIEHTAYVNGQDLRTLGKTLGWQGKSPTFVSWKFKSDGPVDKSQQCLVGECKFISVDFWAKGDYSANFKYDRATNMYLKYTGYDDKDQPAPLIDQESQKQITIKNVVVQFVNEVSIPDDPKHRLDYALVGSGQAIIFIDGKAIKATWKKESRDSRTLFYDVSGNEILFNRGKIWVSIVPDRNIDQVTY